MSLSKSRTKHHQGYVPAVAAEIEEGGSGRVTGGVEVNLLDARIAGAALVVDAVLGVGVGVVEEGVVGARRVSRDEVVSPAAKEDKAAVAD